MGEKAKSLISFNRNTLIAGLKWLVAIVLLVAVFRSDKLSVRHIETFLQHPFAAGLGLALLVFTTLATYIRWNVVLRILGLPMNFWSSIRLGMTGQFFSVVIPGTVGGDLIKAVYVARRFPQKKTRAVTSIFVDRVSGLMAIIILGGIAFLMGYPRILAIGTPKAQMVFAFGAMVAELSAFIVLGLLLFPVVASRLPPKPPAFLDRLPFSGALHQFYQAGLDFREKPKLLWAVVGVSIFFFCIQMSVLWIIANTLFGPAPWGEINLWSFVLSAVLGLCAMSVPITPMGLGVGQIAFSAIFLAIGAPSEDFGTAIVTNFQILQLAIGLAGVLFFLTYRHEIEETMSPVEDLAVKV